MGLSDKDIVALSGGHTLGRAHSERSGFQGPWTQHPLKFDNSYFVEILQGESPGLLQLLTDKCLVEDPVFRNYVVLYAQDEDAFFRDYAESHKKLSELGFMDPSSVASITSRITSKIIVHVVVAVVAMVSLFYFYGVRRRVGFFSSI
eukprot:c19618_g1_i1 orf=256-696(-)